MSSEIKGYQFDACFGPEACPNGVISCEPPLMEKIQGAARRKAGTRHPKLALELPWVFSELEVIKIVKACIKFYKLNSAQGERFAKIF